MCVNKNLLYPCVNLKDGKKKILFDLPYEINNNQDLKELNTKYKFEVSNFYINRLKCRNEIESFDRFVSVPCGHCSECIKLNSRDWACRILMESRCHEFNYFLTLTYDDNFNDNELHKDDLSQFNKKLKIYLKRNKKKSDFKFYSVGEYGLKTLRPHYHGIYFGLEIDDLQYYKTEKGQIYYTSQFLNNIWRKGYVVVGNLDVASACYVARYCDSKLFLNDVINGLVDLGYQPPFNLMSRRPGIAAGFYDLVINRIKNDNSTFYFKGNEFKVPFYFLKKMSKDYPELYQKYLDKYNDYSSLQSYIYSGDLLATDVSKLILNLEADKVRNNFIKKVSIF